MLFIVYIFFSFSIVAQTTNNAQHDINNTINENLSLSATDPDQALLNLKKLKEELIATNHLAEALRCITIITDISLRNKADFHQVIEESKIGLQIAKEIGDFPAVITFKLQRNGAYYQQGLVDLSYRELEEALTYIDKIVDVDQRNLNLAYLYGAISAYYHAKQDTTNRILYLNKSLSVLKNVDDRFAREKVHTSILQLRALGTIFNEQKKTDSAEFYYLEAYKLYNQHPFALANKADLLLTLSNFYYQQQEYRSAIDFARTGLGLNKDNHHPIVKKELYNVLYNSYLEINQIDSSKFFSRLYSNMRDSLNRENEVGLNATVEHHTQQNESNHEQHVRRIVFLGLGLLLVISVGVIYWVRIKQQRIHQNYEALITKLSNRESTTEILTIERPQPETIHPNKDGIYIADETVSSLLKKLEKFERTNKFIKNDVTLSSMAYDLDSNSRYISEIIKEYRGKNFNNYINGLRIEFITEKLYNDPEYRTYKIAYLASYVGFSSGTVFTNVFKKETGMTPSYFIHQLTNEGE